MNDPSNAAHTEHPLLDCTSERVQELSEERSSHMAAGASSAHCRSNAA